MKIYHLNGNRFISQFVRKLSIFRMVGLNTNGKRMNFSVPSILRRFYLLLFISSILHQVDSNMSWCLCYAFFHPSAIFPYTEISSQLKEFFFASGKIFSFQTLSRTNKNVNKRSVGKSSFRIELLMFIDFEKNCKRWCI